MKEELISFATAKVAKEKGFNFECDNYFEDLQNELFHGKGTANLSHPDIYARPTQSLLQKWLRETHGLHVIPKFKRGMVLYTYSVEYRNEGGDKKKNVGFECFEYEQALETGLKDALQLINLD